MLELKSLLERLESSHVFQDWKKEHPKSFLYIFFKIIKEKDNNKDNEDNWEIGFYNPESDTTTSFSAQDEAKICSEDSKIFKPKEEKIKELRLKKVNIPLDKALEILEKLREEKYPSEIPNEKIIILQKRNKVQWNITYLARSMNILNVKIDASSGNIIESSIAPALAFKS